MDVGYQQQAPALWHALMATMALGGIVMAAALGALALGIAASLRPARQGATATKSPLVVDWGGTAISADSRAWVGPLSIVVIVAAMYAFSALGFEMLQALPVSAVGGSADH